VLYQKDPAAFGKAQTRLEQAEHELEKTFARWTELEARANEPKKS
jgi:hypothetical protein